MSPEEAAAADAGIKRINDSLNADATIARLREQLRHARLGLLSIVLSHDDSPGALMRTARHALDQADAADGSKPAPLKPAVIVFDPNEASLPWLDKLAAAVRDHSGGKVIITEVDAGMSDAMIAVAARPVSLDEALAIWERGDDELAQDGPQ